MYKALSVDTFLLGHLSYLLNRTSTITILIIACCFLLTLISCSSSQQKDSVNIISETQDSSIQRSQILQNESVNDSIESSVAKISEGKKYLRNNFTAYIQLNKKSDEGLPGKNLSVALTNKFIYRIDIAKAKLTYFKGGECIDTSTVSFLNIGAGKTISTNAHSIDIATDVQLQLIELKSDELQLCYYLNPSGYTGDDPFRCK